MTCARCNNDCHERSRQLETELAAAKELNKKLVEALLELEGNHGGLSDHNWDVVEAALAAVKGEA